MIDACDRGHLQYPSEELYVLTDTLENIILHILAGDSLNCDTFCHIVENIENCKISLVGCSEHCREFLKSVVIFYLIYFVAKRYNAINNAYKKKSKR